MKTIFAATLFLIFTNKLLIGAEALPLSSEYWKDPAFLKSFNGSYRIEARIEPPVSTEERGLLVEIQSLMAAEKREAALQKLAASPLTAKSPALTFNLGNLYFETGNTEKAITAYRSALKEYPSFRRAHQNLAIALVREEKLPEALEHLTEAIRLGDSSGSTYGLLGYCRLARKEYASALQAYRTAQITEPEVADWKAGMAQCLQQTGAEQEAIALLDEVIAARPKESSYSSLQANIYLALDQNDNAVKALELPFRLGTLSSDSCLQLAALHLNAGRTSSAKAVSDYAFAADIKPSTNSILRLVDSAAKLADWPFAKQLLTQASSTAPTSRALRLATANYQIASGENPAEGTKLMEKLISEEPTDGQALLALAKHRASTGQPDAAELLFERATADDATAYDSHIELARLLVTQTRYAKALKSIDSAIALHSSESLKTYRKALQQTLSATQ